MKSAATTRSSITIASDLLERHILTLVDDNKQWQKLIADDVLWELAYAPSIGHPAQLDHYAEPDKKALVQVAGVGEPKEPAYRAIRDFQEKDFV